MLSHAPEKVVLLLIMMLNLLEIERQIRGVVADAKRTGVLRENLEDIFYKTLEEEY